MTGRRVLTVLVVVVCGWLAAAHAGAGGQQPGGEMPRLVVLLVVDQMRTDYIDRYGAHWTSGLKRILNEGAWYRNAAYPYLNTVTCSGHATIGTGRVPASHGIIMNSWLDRRSGKIQGCTEDTSASAVTAEGIVAGGGDSAWALKGDTLAARVKAGGGRVVTMSLKPRSAIMPAGRTSDATIWFGGRGTFVTSNAYAKELPPFVTETMAAAPVGADRGTAWTKLLPPAAYAGPDDGIGEKPPAGWTTSFPHPLDQPQFFGLWQASPMSDAYLGRLAAAAIDSYKMGRGSAVDFLSVSFSALDATGHSFGPASHEVQDILARLDRTIGGLLAHLDERVGRGRYVLALTADHGVAPIPEQSRAAGLDAGRIDSRAIGDAIDRALQPLLGPGQYAAAVLYTDVYFRPGVWARIADDRAAVNAVKEAIVRTPGVQAAYAAYELTRPRTDDAVQRAAALSYHPERSGDIILVPKRLWIASTAATTHGTLHDYDQRVPVMFFGAGVAPARFEGAASPADVAPTLARLAGVRLKKTDGQPLQVNP